MSGAVFVVDLGGTWLRTAVFHPADRRLSGRGHQPTPDDPGACRHALEAAWRMAGCPPSVGIAAAPALDPAGVVRAWSNRPAYRAQPLLPPCLSQGARVTLLDDGTAAAMSAYGDSGAGVGGIVLALAVGTGLGGGAVIGGRPLMGAGGAAMDVGHIKVPVAAGWRCSCGDDGCVQAIASGRAIAARLAAGEREPAVLDRAAEGVRALVSILTRIFDPDRIALCGGLGLGPLRSRLLAEDALPLLERHPDGEDAALIGAGLTCAKD